MNLNQYLIQKDTLLWKSVRDNKLKTIKDLFSSNQVTPNDLCVTESGHSYLHESITTNRREVFILCVLFNADVNQKDDKTWTPLLKASALGRVRMIPELLQRGADPFQKDDRGENSFDKALKFDRIEAYKQLTSYAKISYPNHPDLQKYNEELEVDENEKF